MALLGFFGSQSKETFYGRKRGFYIQTDNEFLPFDLLTDESHNMPADVTAYNIEDGSNVTENIRLPLRTGSVVGFISNYSIQQTQETTIVGRIQKRLQTLENRAQQGFDALERMREERQPVTIMTNLKFYEKVLITNIDVSRDDSIGESQYFTINFVEARIVKLKSVAVDVTVKLKDMKSNKRRQASAKLDTGRN